MINTRSQWKRSTETWNAPCKCKFRVHVRESPASGNPVKRRCRHGITYDLFTRLEFDTATGKSRRVKVVHPNP